MQYKERIKLPIEIVQFKNQKLTKWKLIAVDPRWDTCS